MLGEKKVICRNPFQGGMGFFTGEKKVIWIVPSESQSLSGWDGVFHPEGGICHQVGRRESQSLSGWDGVFHGDRGLARGDRGIGSQSLSGWDGVFHKMLRVWLKNWKKSQSLSGWDGVFHPMV